MSARLIRASTVVRVSTARPNIHVDVSQVIPAQTVKRISTNARRVRACTVDRVLMISTPSPVPVERVSRAEFARLI